MDVIWHGHACFEISGNDLTVVVDPHDGKSIGIKPPVCSADVVLVSHTHSDHNAAKVIRGNHVDIIAQTGKFDIKGMEIIGYPSFHDEEQGAEYGPNVIYKFKMDGIVFCHCGDLGDIPSEEVIDDLQDVDILFVPVGEVFTIGLDKLQQFISMIHPKIIVPMSYRVGGLTLPINTIDDFLDTIDDDSVIYVGNEVDLTSEDVSEFMGCWVFDH
ncbi:MAG: MBL fold metallo-hydrolase [Candidatus Methanomethylophilaceae archaeon]